LTETSRRSGVATSAGERRLERHEEKVQFVNNVPLPAIRYNGFKMIFACMVVALSIVLFVCVRSGKLKIGSFALNILISVFTLLCLCALLELVFYAFFVYSDGFSFTLASKRWNARYWKPINAYGYRDTEHVHVNAKKILFVVGDSIVAGHGIEDYRDRFSNVLARKLGESWEVISIAKNGWDTNDEYDAMVTYPLKPHMIILSYFINDIEGAARKSGERRPVLMQDKPPPLLAPLIKHSYCANYFYWRIHRHNFADTLANQYREYLTRAYESTHTWQVHQKELTHIMEYAGSNGSELIVIVFPDFSNIEQSKAFTSKIVAFMNENGVRVIDMASRLNGRSTADLVVSAIDAHPNTTVHGEIAEILYEAICEGKTLRKNDKKGNGGE